MEGKVAIEIKPAAADGSHAYATATVREERKRGDGGQENAVVWETERHFMLCCVILRRGGGGWAAVHESCMCVSWLWKTYPAGGDSGRGADNLIDDDDDDESRLSSIRTRETSGETKVELTAPLHFFRLHERITTILSPLERSTNEQKPIMIYHISKISRTEGNCSCFRHTR